MFFSNFKKIIILIDIFFLFYHNILSNIKILIPIYKKKELKIKVFNKNS